MKLNSQRTLTAAVGALLAAAALYLLWVTHGFPLGRRGEPGPALWPRLVLTLTFGVAVYLVVDVLRSRADRPFAETSILLPAGFMGFTVLYLLLMQGVGFFLMTAIFLGGSMRMLGIRSWKTLLGVSVGFPAAAYIVFVQVLHGSFPAGWLAPLLGGGR